MAEGDKGQVGYVRSTLRADQVYNLCIRNHTVYIRGHGNWGGVRASDVPLSESHKMSAVTVVVLCLVSMLQTASPCIDENNNSVDWYVIYKLPRVKSSNNSLIKQGVAYSYITSHNVSQGWVLSTYSINDSNSMPGRTLQPLYNKTDDLLWIEYNDQPPNASVTLAYGHTKGVVLAHKHGGLWLVHSVPHYPPTTGYSYPHTGTHYGQSFLCISLNASQLDLVGVQLTYNKPKIYNSGVAAGLVDQFPHLVAAIRNTTVKSAPWYNMQPITSQNGTVFYSFAKAAKFNKELYFDWVAPMLETTLLVESWQNGEGKLASSCNRTYMVENVATLSMKTAGVHFKSTLDHSKWAVSDVANKDWVCVGDINRMESQETRGGGTVCINHYKLWPAYRQLIQSVQPCPAQHRNN
ncbi:hypothetical protein L9F63_008555 [Diploptera punctata]|uniref:Uncharacterized protein n=1 Tax=Diploptera punctata TaxID=6984 RepID=A0AAD7Z519_DIPPU|nr:hypothetical protein L9F63_008555 [Diploptera punctata]